MSKSKASSTVHSLVYVGDSRTATASETIRRYAKEHRLLVWDMYDVVGGKRRACVNWTEAKLH